MGAALSIIGPILYIPFLVPIAFVLSKNTFIKNNLTPITHITLGIYLLVWAIIIMIPNCATKGGLTDVSTSPVVNYVCPRSLIIATFALMVLINIFFIKLFKK